jgi:DNA-binding IclR family transcriptional regulator
MSELIPFGSGVASEAELGQWPGGPPEDFVQSVGRALRILEVVSTHRALTVKGIARRCGLNLSTTYHLVRTLAYEDYLERLPNGTYTPGSQLAQTFYAVLATMGKPRTSHAVLRHLSARTGLSAYLGRLQNGQVVVADYVEGPASPHLEDFERGLAVSGHATALGKVLLAALPADNRRQFLSNQGLRRFTTNSVTDVAELETQMTAINLEVPVMEHGEFRQNVSCAACLIPPPVGQSPVWAVAISILGESVPESAQRELRRAARDM